MCEQDFVAAEVVNSVKSAPVIGVIARFVRETRCVLLVILLASLMPFAFAEKTFERAYPRYKREGFGPWEQDDTLKTFEDLSRRVISTIVEEEKKIVEVVEKTIERVETEVKTFVLTSGRVLVWILAVVAFVVFLRLSYPCLCISFRFLWKIFSGLFNVIARMTCCMSLCATYPFRTIRNWYIARKQRLADEAIVVEEAIQLQPGGVRYTSEVFFDTMGPYVKGMFGDKIYFKRQNLDIPTYMALGCASPSSERFEEERVKETMLARSTPHIVPSLPDFQAYFTSGGNVVGQCARISFRGYNCLITAYHVLSYNVKADLYLNANGKSVRLSDVRTSILAYSNAQNLDYIVLTISDAVCAKLGLKKAKLARGVSHGSPVSIYQIIEGQTCYTVGIVQKGEQPWTLKYGASTVEGSSGAPILNVRKEIVGIHTEGGKAANMGTVPELIRSYKESPQNGDINAEDPRSCYREELEEKYGEQEFEDADTYDQYLVKNARLDRQDKNWWELMDEIDEDFERGGGRILEGYDRLVFIDERRSKDQHPKKRKESPWTCSKCLTLHLRAGYNCQKCGFSLVKGAKVAIEEKKKAIQESVTPVVADCINKHLDNIAKKQDYLEGLIKDVLERKPTVLSHALQHEVPSVMRRMPDSVSMTKDLAVKLQTAPPLYVDMNTQGVAIRPKDEKIVAVNVDSGIKATAPLAVEVVKKHRPRRRRGGKKETTTVSKVVSPAVPLNSKSPSRDGEGIINGKSQSSFPDKVVLSGVAAVPSTPQSQPRKANFGQKLSKFDRV